MVSKHWCINRAFRIEFQNLYNSNRFFDKFSDFLTIVEETHKGIINIFLCFFPGNASNIFYICLLFIQLDDNSAVEYQSSISRQGCLPKFIWNITFVLWWGLVHQLIWDYLSRNDYLEETILLCTQNSVISIISICLFFQLILQKALYWEISLLAIIFLFIPELCKQVSDFLLHFVFYLRFWTLSFSWCLY